MDSAPPSSGPVSALPAALPATSASVAPLVPGTLYLVATPIGNLEDITLRALRVLRDCTVVAAEDTRRTGQLLTHFGLRKPMVSYFRFNEARRGAEILDRLRMGEIVALVTDAGAPGISDPGERVVAQVLAAGLRVESIPGACALVVGLTASGLPTESFHFAGFLPHKSGQRARRLGELGAIPGTLVLYESPFRVERLLGELQLILPGRPVVLARELTKKFEEWLRGTPAELAAEWARRPRKGEFVVMIGPTGHTGSPTAGRVTSDAMDDTADETADETKPRSEESVDSPTD